MKITSDLFHAHLKCPTKCWLRATSELAIESKYPEWVKAQSHTYRRTEVARLIAASPRSEITHSPNLIDLKTAKWRLTSSLATSVQTESRVLESEIHAVQLVPAKGRGQAAYLIPIRFIFTNKLDNDDKLLLAFDAFTLSRALGHEIRFGTIIHGDNHVTTKVKILPLVAGVRKHIDKIAVLLESSLPPELTLNRHCAECEFQARCHKEAIQQDALAFFPA